MTTNDAASDPSCDSAALAIALNQSRDVKARVDSAVDELSRASDLVKDKVATGTPRAAAQIALSSIVRVEVDVQGCADDLHAVNESLAQGVADLRSTEEALAVARAALATSRASLVASKEAEEEARKEALHDAMSHRGSPPDAAARTWSAATAETSSSTFSCAPETTSPKLRMR